MADEGTMLALESFSIWSLGGSLPTHMPESVLADEGRKLVWESFRILASLPAHT
jgi:hypothetical protein